MTAWWAAPTGPYAWSVTGGSLPAGLVLDGATGVISGTPVAGGVSHFGLGLRDRSPPTAGTVTGAFASTVDQYKKKAF
ncbi:Putative Ig domain-containing protein [Streptomyces sp. DvalAA-14]|uniref:Ig domain-containing protein n=1 Tax=unclassified Streptomyces TaxID=2593676 RepID=UPI00081B5089|nr:Ig domain-containing protein [Streptomyces sp. DvalAA-14]SCE26781.1 Putative Ig domain-containing protein [Streptomyces sp. DvalAA-14]